MKVIIAYGGPRAQASNITTIAISKVREMHNRLAWLGNRVLADDTVRHGSIMVGFVGLGTIFNFLFTFAMMRMLSPAEYGTFLALLSVLLIVGVFSGPVETAAARFVSKEWVQRKLGRINYLWQFFLKRAFLLGLALFLILAVLSPLLTRFLRLENIWYFAMLFSSLIFAFAASANWGVLRGLQRFWSLGSTGALWNFLKLGFAVILISLGLGMSGGLLAFPLAYVASFLVTLLLLRDLSRAGNEKVTVNGVASYFGLAFLALFAFNVLTNVDVILAKHFLTDEDAGVFAATSILGKIALFVPGGVLIAMFPKTSAAFESGRPHLPMLRKTLLLTLFLSGIVVAIYGFFPEFIGDILGFFRFRLEYRSATPYLFEYGMAMLLFAVSFLLVNYFLSLSQTKVAYPLLVAMALEIVLLSLFHSGISQIIHVMLISGAASVLLVLPLYMNVRRADSLSKANGETTQR